MPKGPSLSKGGCEGPSWLCPEGGNSQDFHILAERPRLTNPAIYYPEGGCFGPLGPGGQDKVNNICPQGRPAIYAQRASRNAPLLSDKEAEGALGIY